MPLALRSRPSRLLRPGTNLDTIVVRLRRAMEGLTINEAAETTGWSPRMLRYIESAGLIEPPRTPKGYRIFGPGELQRLRTLRELLTRFDCALSDVAFAKRLGSDARADARPSTAGSRSGPQKPAEVDAAAWLSWEQRKHERLLATTPRPRESRRPPPHDRHRRHAHHARLQGRRHLARRLRPQGDHPCRARDARPDGHARGVRRRASRSRARASRARCT